MPSIEMKFWLIPAVCLFSMFCLLKYIWNQCHNDVLFVCEDGSHDSGQQKKDTSSAKVKVIRISTQTQVHTGEHAQYAVPQVHSKVIRIPIHQAYANAAGLTKPDCLKFKNASLMKISISIVSVRNCLLLSKARESFLVLNLD